MASSSEKSSKLPEKSSFSQTCSLLSQYLKEKGSFGDLSLGMTCNIEANGASDMPRLSTTSTMNLFPMIEKSGDVFAHNTGAPRNLESMNLFPQQAGFACKKDTPSVVDPSLNKPVSAPVEPQAAQMTIFYGGQVIVFNDFPADKAKEVMLLASMGSSNSHTTTFPSDPAMTHNAFASNLAKSPIESTGPVTPPFVKNPTELNCTMPPSSNIIPSFGNNLIPEQAQPPQRPVTCDLPIARRNSLHRFLEKRKDRIVARAPYQAISSTAAAPNKPAESKSWLGLAAQSAQ